jgi:hypothetical protein
MIKFGFQIRTRSGQKVDNILIQAVTRGDAERRLYQMYQHCEILDCRERELAARLEALDVEAVIGLISREPVRPTL